MGGVSEEGAQMGGGGSPLLLFFPLHLCAPSLSCLIPPLRSTWQYFPKVREQKSILRGGSQTVTGAPIYQLPCEIYSRIVVYSSARESTGRYEERDTYTDISAHMQEQ